MSLSISGSLDTFSYDLDSAHLKLEKLSTRWQLSPVAKQPLVNELVVEQLQAKRLTITLKPNTTQKSGLPDNIKLPFPVRILQSDIAEVIVIHQGTQQVFHNVQLQLTGDHQTLALQLVHASTPWGEASGKVKVSTLQPFAMEGTVAIKQTNAPTPHHLTAPNDLNSQYDLTAQWHGNLRMVNMSSNVWVSAPPNQAMRLTSTPSPEAAANIHLQGQLSLLDAQPFTMQASIVDLHPEKLGPYPAAKLHLNLALQGQLQPSLQATANISSTHSTWNQQPITLTADAALMESAIETMHFKLGVGNNVIQGNGRLQAEQVQIDWLADLTDLSALNAQYAGKLHASGQLHGPMRTPALSYKVQANALQFANNNASNPIQIQQLDSQATLDFANQGAVTGTLTASQIVQGKQPPFNAEATLQGRVDKHQLSLHATGAPLAFHSVLEGGIRPTTATTPLQWDGHIQTMEFTHHTSGNTLNKASSSKAATSMASTNKTFTDFSGQTRVKLTAPASLHANLHGIQLGKTMLQLTQGSAVIESLVLTQNTLNSQGQLTEISLADLPSGLVAWPPTLKGNPIFSGTWDIQANDTLNAILQLQHVSGDLSYSNNDNTLTPFGLSDASATLTVRQNQAQLIAKLAGRHIGHANLDLSTTVSKVDNTFQVLPDAPLRLNAEAALNTLAWLPMPSALMDSALDGKISASAQANGTLQAPNLSGTLTGEQIQFHLPSEGVDFTQGSVSAAFEGNRLTIQRATWQGGKGQLTSQGWLTLVDGKPTMELDWRADKFTALSRADRLLTLSGTGKTQLSDNLLSISGHFNVDEGLIELSSEDTPALSNDVVILGQTMDDSSPALDVLLNAFTVELGEHFSLRGRGLDAMLTGAITLNGLTQYNPHAQGSIQVSKGTFMAYGQVLSIDRGILNFSGVMDNPGLDIRAMRNSKPVNAGVEITGNANNPMTKLVSDPSVPESEKLSWLVLGHGLDSAGKNDYGMLSLAAGVLLSQGQSVPLQTQLARAAGLDEFSFTGGDVEGASLTLGKRLTSQLYLSYAKSITGLLDVARLTYNITPRWLLRAEAGTESAVDVLYTFSFN